jgi:hypothetical protein
MIGDWSVPFVLQTDAGNLALNDTNGPSYMILNDACDAGADIRFTADLMPQSDGQLNHTQYLTGYKMRLALALWNDPTSAACGEDAQDMLDELDSHIDALRNPVGTTRLVWTPTNKASRMANDIVLAERAIATVVPGRSDGLVAVTFAVVSAFPYAMSEAEQTPNAIDDSAHESLVNDGTTRFWPVFKVYGPTSNFTITNETTGDLLHWDGDMIGTGEYIEIDMFRATVYLNGNQDNLLDGINFLETDFWALDRGLNYVTIDGADCDVLWNNAYL